MEVLQRVKTKWHLCGSSLAASILGATPANMLQDLKTFGFLYESFSIQELRAYAKPARGKVLHYRDESGPEADAIVDLEDGRWGTVEDTTYTFQVF